MNLQPRCLIGSWPRDGEMTDAKVKELSRYYAVWVNNRSYWDDGLVIVSLSGGSVRTSGRQLSRARVTKQGIPVDYPER
jgi:hypothetical protein